MYALQCLNSEQLMGVHWFIGNRLPKYYRIVGNTTILPSREFQKPEHHIATQVEI